MKKLILLCFMVLSFTSLVCGLCGEGDIDINNASLEELEEIDHVGPAVAGYIIEARPFNSLDELVNVSHISSGYLEDIITQGLACVENEYEEPEEVVEEQTIEDVIEEEDLLNESVEDLVEDATRIGLVGKPKP